jgi:hypothetical protein
MNVFIEVYNASDDYWNNKKYTGNQLRLSHNSKVIAADAVGALLGLVGGPWWSIAQGAIVSIAFEEDPSFARVIEGSQTSTTHILSGAVRVSSSYGWEY